MISIRKYGLLIITVIASGLVITAWNLESPPLWLTLMGWILLVIPVGAHVVSLPKTSPYFGAFALSVLAFLLLSGLSPTASLKLFQFIFQPSFDHLINFLISRAFLLTAIVYFAAACLSYGTRLQKAESERDKYKEDSEELERLKTLKLEEVMKATKDGEG